MFNLEHLPVFRASREGEGCSAPVHGRGTLRTSPRKQKINCMGRGQTMSVSRGHTSQLLHRIGPVGRFGENLFCLYHFEFGTFWISLKIWVLFTIWVFFTFNANHVLSQFNFIQYSSFVTTMGLPQYKFCQQFSCHKLCHILSFVRIWV